MMPHLLEILVLIFVIIAIFIFFDCRLVKTGLYERNIIAKKYHAFVFLLSIPFLGLMMTTVKTWNFSAECVRAFIEKHGWSLVIFFILLLLSVASFVYLHAEYGHPLRQSIAGNVATDALFALITIFAIGYIDALRRNAENRRANELVYADLKLALRKIMLRLLIELGYEEKESAVRTNFTYLQQGDDIFGAFWRLGRDTERLNEFMRGFQNRTADDIKRMVRIKKIINEGLTQISLITSRIRPAPFNTDILGQYKYWEIEDMEEYAAYLRHGKIYGPYFFPSPDDPSKTKGGVGIHTVDWQSILGEFRTNLASTMSYIADIYEGCIKGEI